MAELTDRDIDAALARGVANRASEPRATSVKFDATSERLVIELSNGCTFALPSQLIEGLAGATANQIKRVEILGSGYSLHWPELDIDITVPALLSGVFGTRAHMARLAGAAKSEAKAAAARANGAKGGRPRKRSA